MKYCACTLSAISHDCNRSKGRYQSKQLFMQKSNEKPMYLF